MSTFQLNSLPISFASFAAAAFLMGCGSGGSAVPFAPDPVTAPVSSLGNVTGNWQGSLIATGGTKAMGVLAGSIDQSGGSTSAGQFTTAVFRIDSGCFSATPSIPAQGFIKSTDVTLNSFAVDHQYVALTGTTANAGSAITGTYAVHGGCAEGSVGNFSIVRYAPFSGTYAGSLGGERSLTLTSIQADGANGAGAFPVAATATFKGFPCFTQGTAMASDNPTISGASISLLFTTDDRSGGQFQLTGSINPDAGSVTSVAYAVTSGSCSGLTGIGTLIKGK